MEPGAEELRGVPADARVAEVVLDLAGREIDRPFDYLVPARLEESARPGCRVRVAFGRRRAEEKRGEGVHHIAYQVENIDQALAELKSKGIPLIDQQARRGAHHSRVAFLNPKGTYGILIELVEPEKS